MRSSYKNIADISSPDTCFQRQLQKFKIEMNDKALIVITTYTHNI